MSVLLYIGPGLGAGTIVLVLLVVGLVVFSLLYLIWTPIKKFFRKVKQLFSGK
jgi:hypothetical protein